MSRLKAKTKPPPPLRKPTKPASRKARAAPVVVEEKPVRFPYGETIPTPVRLTKGQLQALDQKRAKTGVPIQELVRRAIDHMLATMQPHEVPERIE